MNKETSIHFLFTSDGASLILNGYGNSHQRNTENPTVVDIVPLLDSEAIQSINTN